MRVHAPTHGGKDLVAHSVDIRSNCLVRKSKDVVAELFEIVAPNAIHSSVVLGSIKLDDEPDFQTNEIRDVSANRALSAKLEAAEVAIAQAPPHRLLDIGRVRSHGARARP